MTSTPADLPMPAPELKTDVVRVGDAVVCVLSGDLHAGTRAIGEQALGEALDSGPAVLVIDLDAVELFTADGLNLLLALQDSARPGGARGRGRPQRGGPPRPRGHRRGGDFHHPLHDRGSHRPVQAVIPAGC
ncbi:STAS domain-containing protein [Streptomyces sp. NPDC048331]|uniref:STAS domain-containing protein n=1 Tax=Streptomyces sp. NPDC048331 TaxID=3365534 RepID=UPI0037218414